MSKTYDATWRKLREAHLSQHPFCAYCLELGYTRLAEVVDHIVPIREDPTRRLDPSNLQSLCTPCHNQVKQSEEATGRQRGCNSDGTPRGGWPTKPPGIK